MLENVPAAEERTDGRVGSHAALSKQASLRLPMYHGLIGSKSPPAGIIITPRAILFTLLFFVLRPKDP